MTKPVIVTRIGKGSELTFQEGDANFTNLQDATVTVAGDSGTAQAVDLNGTITVAGGTGLSTSMSTGAVTVNLDNTAVNAGAYTNADITVDAQGRVTSAANGAAGYDDADARAAISVTTATEAETSALTYDNTTGAFTFTPVSTDDLIDSVVQDTTPQLGGSLDVNGNAIVSTSDANIELTPDGTGRVVISGQQFPGAGSAVTGTVTAVDDVIQPNTLTLSNTAGLFGNEIINFTGTGVASIGLDSAISYRLNAGVGGDAYEIALASGGGPIALTDPGTVTDVNYSVTVGGANSGDFLVYGAGGDLSWMAPTPPAPPPPMTLSQDPNPQLGGNLLLNGNQIRAEGTDSLFIFAAGSGTLVLAHNQSGSNIQVGTQGCRVSSLSYNEKIGDMGTASGTIAPNVGINGNVQTITLNGNLTLNAFDSPVAGQSVTLIVNTGGTDRTLTSSMLFAGGEKTLSETDTTDIISIFYDGTNYWASLSKDFN